MFEIIICLAIILVILYIVYKKMEAYVEGIRNGKRDRFEAMVEAEIDRDERRASYEASRKKRLSTKMAVDEFLDSKF